MGFFDMFKKKAEPAAPTAITATDDPAKVCAPVSGDAIQLSETDEPVFSAEVMGKGIAIKPSGETAYAPVSGTVTTLFQTLHAVGLTAEGGAEVLIHIGIDTVEMNGKGFSAHCKQGDTVKAGAPLVSFSKKEIAAAGKDATVFVIITNTDDYAAVKPIADATVSAGDVVIEVEK